MPEFPAESAENLVDLVNPLQGTASRSDFSRGNTSPLVARPFGMTHWTPQTDEGRWPFHPDTHKLQGVRATHQASPWMGDYGHFVVMAQSGEPLPRASERASAFRLEELTVRPHVLSVTLRRYGIRLEMTPTERCGVFRFTFPAGQPARVILEPSQGESGVEINAARSTITGFTRANSGGVPPNFACHYAAVFSRPFVSASALPGEREGAVAEFGDGGGQVEMTIGTSFLSAEQALRNLEREVGGRDFDAVRAEGEAVWNAALGRVAIAGGTEAQRRTFYSGLYRTQLFPRAWHEFDAAREPVHFSPYDGRVHAGVLYADNGFWDTYRTVYPLLALLMPERLAEILQGWTNACREGGWFPQWASPGYRACMVGTHIDAVMADAVVKGVTGFDVEAAYAGLVRHATEPGDRWGNYGRLGLADYLEHGYVVEDHQDHSVARSLDYAYDDWCLSRIARVLGRREDESVFRARADNYRHLYDPAVGFMRAREADGAWREPFAEFAWGGPYVEGGPWQSSWAVPHDPAGLIALMGGPEAFVSKLDRMLAQEPRFEVGAYGFEIHEMTEMADAAFGQYAHSNQPVHHVLALYAAAGRPDRMRHWTRRVMDELYSPDHLPGDEDNGEMSAWYVLNALGLYPLCPGHPSYVLGSPLFPAARVRLPNGRDLVIEAADGGPGRAHVCQVTINGRAHRPLWVSHDAVMQGGHWRFEMSDAPSMPPGLTPTDLPYSLSQEEAP